jgi:hypothetical protein
VAEQLQEERARGRERRGDVTQSARQPLKQSRQRNLAPGGRDPKGEETRQRERRRLLLEGKEPQEASSCINAKGRDHIHLRLMEHVIETPIKSTMQVK